MYSYLFAARIDLLFFVLGAFLVGKWEKKQIADPYALSAYESVLQKELFFFNVFLNNLFASHFSSKLTLRFMQRRGRLGVLSEFTKLKNKAEKL